MLKNKHHKKIEKVQVALWNIAAVASIAAVIFRSQVFVIGSTGLATVYHVVLLFINDEYI